MNPWKLPANAYLPLKAMSELAKLSEPMFAGLKNPAGRSLWARSSMPLLAEPASSQPAERPSRGSTAERGRRRHESDQDERYPERNPDQRTVATTARAA